ncbi:class I SAM-dependent methyltransferase [Candidatus Saccharibacteria bacterium]|nr:class I SAM-dependent methyltransferase [Candidatus Saccharibacteria bacterium]
MIERLSYSFEEDIYHNLPEHLATQEFGQLQGLFDNLEAWTAHPTGGDARIREFAFAGRYLIATDDRVRASLGFMLDFRNERNRPTTPLYAINHWLRTTQHHLRDRADYAELSTTAEGWAEGIQELLNNKWNHDAYDSDLALREVQTNVPARYKGPQLILALYGNRFDRPINYLDIGTSIGAGAKGLMTNKLEKDIRVVIPVPGDVPNSAKANLEESLPLTTHINRLLGSPLEFGPSAAVDIMGVQDTGQGKWIKSCFYPSEIAENTDAIKDFDELTQESVPNLILSTLDFTDNDGVDDFIKVKSPVEKYDVITILTMLHQLREDEVASVLANAKKALAPDGLIIVQDFARTNPKAANGLEFPEKWHPYSYRSILIDPGSGSDDPVELLWWQSGRCREVIIAPSATFFAARPSLENNNLKYGV